MKPPAQKLVPGRNHSYTRLVPGHISNQTSPNRTLWGKDARQVMGILQIACGGIEFVVGIALILVPWTYDDDDHYNTYDRLDFVGWGIWTGVFAIVTGSLGIGSFRLRSLVNVYMVTSIIVAVMCAGSLIYAILGALNAAFTSSRGANLAMYMILFIFFFIQMMFSLIEVSSTCGALCNTTTKQTQRVVSWTPHEQLLAHESSTSPPYTGFTVKTTLPSVNGANSH